MDFKCQLKQNAKKRFKHGNNMDIIDELQNARLIIATDPEDENANNTRHSRIITRIQLSTLG